VFCLVLGPDAHAQTETATIRGSVTDPTGAVVPNAMVRLIDIDRGIQSEVATGNSGFYTFASVRPGHYRMEVEKTGFKLARLTGITVNVQDNLEQHFKLALGPRSEAVTVEASAVNLNTTDAAVSTLIDNRFVTNMPLNGRSFSSLLDLTPGVVLTPTNFYDQGQFSVNGQRPDANYLMVDGASANLGVVGNGSINLGQSGAGQLPATSAFGGTSNLVSLDGLQEFRVQTSTFAPEYGRTPGAQISVVTKSGTNAFHGTAFEYFRNDVLDAANWFNAYTNNPPLPKAEERQNDFGGVFGGPILRDKLFFFGSYEGVRLRQPKVANTYVPSRATLQNADPAVQPLVNAFPKPTGPDNPDGTAPFSASYSDPATLDSASVRVDYVLPKNITVFARYSDAPSEIKLRAIPGTVNDNYSTIENVKYHTQTLTAGTNQALGSRSTNEFRLNYSRSRSHNFSTLDNFGGAVPPPESVLYPFQPAASPQNSEFIFLGDFNRFGLKWAIGKLSKNLMQQINVTDNFSHVVAKHQLKFGVDYRRLHPTVEGVPYIVQYIYGSIDRIVQNNAAYAFVGSETPNVQLAFSNWSLFAQDTWRFSRSLTVTYGLRWEYNAAPSSPNGTLPFTVDQVHELATMQLAPPGTQLWDPEKHDFAPRLGLAWNPHPNLVIRAGAGIFYDLGYSTVSEAMSTFPFQQGKYIFPGNSPLKFPLDANDAKAPPFTTSPPVNLIAVVDPHHLLPRTYEWNAAVEQSLSTADVFTLTYLGAGGRKLMRKDFYLAPNSNFANPGLVEVMRNASTSNYNALQAQYRHRVSHGLQGLLSYTWSHSIDDVSSDGSWFNVPPGQSPSSSERGPSDYDIRHTFSAAVSYDIPGPGSGVMKQILGNWSTDSIIYVRSATPVNVVTGKNPFPGTLLSGANSVQRPNVVPGVPFYLHPSSAPGGKIINAGAFCIPSPTCQPFVPGQVQGDLGRNALRGFGATQWDITLRRQFRFTERVSLQARGDFFNILNHPNFGNPINYLNAPSSTPFGVAPQTLNNYLGTGGGFGGFNPLYQIGGPRSIQLALKLQF